MARLLLYVLGKCKQGLCLRGRLVWEKVLVPHKRHGTFRLEFRAIRWFDVASPKTSFSPDGGSWWANSPIPAPQQTLRWPALALQIRTTETHGKVEETKSFVSLVSLRERRLPRMILRFRSLELESPHPGMDRERKTIGSRIRYIEVTHPKGRTPSCKIIRQFIPSPFNRCKCRPDEEIRFQWMQRQFMRVNDL